MLQWIFYCGKTAVLDLEARWLRFQSMLQWIFYCGSAERIAEYATQYMFQSMLQWIFYCGLVELVQSGEVTRFQSMLQWIFYCGATMVTPRIGSNARFNPCCSGFSIAAIGRRHAR